jgi:hypothetical protein
VPTNPPGRQNDNVLTPYADLDAVLTDLAGSVREILGDTHLGTYVQGSFALGAGDRTSDCDFITVTTVQPTGVVEADLRRLHDAIPTRSGYWNDNLEGSYADADSLRSAAGLGVPWLYCDRGHREMIRDTHCNTLHTRWILRHHGITVTGPPIADLVDDPSPAAMRAAMRAELRGVLEGIQTWASFEVAWTQRYAVATYCRILYTLRTAKVTSKRGALEWALATMDARWRPLLTQVLQDRDLGWDPADPPRPGALTATYEFAAYAESFVTWES